MSLVTLLLPVALADALINEVLYDPDNSVDDGANEWVELCNPTSKTIDLSGWMIESAGSSFGESWTFPEGTTIAPGEYYVFGPGAGDKDEFSPNLQNGGSATDGVRLTNASGDPVDTVLYDTGNTNKLLDDLGSTKGPFAPDVSAGSSLARFPDCTETTNDGDDWVQADTLTPGAANPSPPDCSLDKGAEVVINEFMANPAGSDSGAEWVELHNTGSVPADLSDWMLLGGTAPGGSLGDAFPAGTTIAPGEYLIVGGENVAKALGSAPDVVISFSLGNASSNADGIMLADCDEVIYDTVVYGPSLNKGDGWLEDDGTEPSSLAPGPGDGESVGRLPNGADTDSSGADFAALDFPTPWEANDIVGTCDGQDAIKINEFLANPDSDDTSADETREWVELYNDSSDVVDLAGWELQWGTSSYGGSFTIPEGVTIAANGFLVIGGVNVPEADVLVPEDDDLSMGAASSSLDALRLLHCGPGLSDTVIYGPDDADNAEGWTDDSGALVSSWAPKVVAGQSTARRSDGLDTDASGDDFVISGTPSPGAANPEVSCEATDGSIVLNEIFPDPSGTDGGNEWVELLNTSSADIALDDWSIQTGSSSWTTKFSFPPGSVLGAGEHMVVADEDVPAEGADLYSSTNLSLGNASTGLDGVRLLDCPGDVADTLLYGKTDAYAVDDEEPWEDDAGGQTYAIFPDSDLSIARYPDGTDTDDNGADFQTNAAPTPGRANEAGAGSDTGDIGGGGDKGGCGKDPVADPKGMGALLGGPLLALLFAGFVRRRRQ